MLETVEAQAVEAVAESRGAEGEKGDGLKEARAKFDAILAKQKAADADEAPREKPAKKPKAEKPAKAQASTETEAPKEAEPAKKPDREVERLRAKLALAGHPKKAIESLADEDVREWWRNVEEREAAQEDALRRAAVLEKKLKSPADATGDGEPQRGVPTSDPDLDAIERELAAQFGEDEAGVISKAFRQLTEPIRAKVAAMEDLFRAAKERGVEDISAKNRNRLSEKWPHLKENDRAWGLIQKEVLSAFEADPTAYKSPEEAFDDIASGIYGDLEVQATNGHEVHDSDAEEETATLKARISASGPTTSERKGKPKPATPMDAARAVFNHLREDPEDVVGAQRAWRRSAPA